MIYQNTYGSKLYPVREIKTLKEMLDTGATLFKDKPAFLAKAKKGGIYQELTHRQLKTDVDALGTKLIEMGLLGEKIAIIGDNSYQWITSYFAVVNGVGIVVPLDKELSPAEIYNLIETVSCKAVFYTSNFESIFKEYDIPFKFKMEVYSEKDAPESEISWRYLVNEGRKLLSAGDTRFIEAEINPNEMKIMLFTSGTMDIPKAVMLSHGNVISNVISTSQIVHLKEDERTLSVLPIHHTFESTMGIMTVLFQGCSIAFYEGLKYVTKNLEEAKASALVGVPLIFESIYDKIWKQAEKTKKAGALRAAINLNKTLKVTLGVDASRKLFKSVYASFGGRLRLLITGAAAIDPKVLRGFQDLGFEVAQGYGLTEAAPLVTGTPDFTNRYKKAGSCGPVIPGGELQIVDQDEEGIGEIIYRGPNVMLGYYNMPELTAEVIRDGWFYTGDLGFVDENGWLYITGRKKNIVVTKTGKNIFPEEIERQLMKIPYIAECMVYGLQSSDKKANNDDTIVAVKIQPNYERIYEEFGENFGENQIYALLKKHVMETNQGFPNYKWVHHIAIQSGDFVKTTTKKIKRHENM